MPWGSRTRKVPPALTASKRLWTPVASEPPGSLPQSRLSDHPVRVIRMFSQFSRCHNACPFVIIESDNGGKQFGCSKLSVCRFVAVNEGNVLRRRPTCFFPGTSSVRVPAVCEIAQMARGISQHLVEQVGELSDDSTVSVVYADQGAHGRDLRKVVLGAWGRGRHRRPSGIQPQLRN